MTDAEIALLDLIDHPVFVLEPDAAGLPRYVAFNARAQAILGRPLHRIVGHTAAELYGGRMGRVATERHLAVLRTGVQTVHEIILPVADGERMVRTVLTPQKDVGGRVVRIVATSTDETEKHTLRDSRDAWQSATHDMEQFVNIAAHDLRAPMRHVTTLARMMREDFSDLEAERLELVDLLEDVGQRALSVIGGILSHAEAGAVTCKRTRFALSDLICETRALVDPFERFELDAPDGVLDADRTVLQIVLRNLFDNAVKYGMGGTLQPSGRLRLSLEVENAPGGCLGLTIRDNGPGFSARSLERLNDAAFTQEGGYGLIAIRRLLCRMDGTLAVGNREDGGGAEIRVHLPGVWWPAEDVPAPQRAAG